MFGENCRPAVVFIRERHCKSRVLKFTFFWCVVGCMNLELKELKLKELELKESKELLLWFNL